MKSVVERIDRRLRLGGGFVVACDNGASDVVRPVAELDAQMVLARTPRSAARDAAIPHVVGFVALPLAALSVVIHAIDSGDRERALGQQALGQVRLVARGVDDMLEQAGDEAAQAAASDLKAALAAAIAATDEAGRSKAMRDVADQLDQLASEVSAESPLADSIEQLAFDAEVAAIEDSGAVAEVKEPDVPSPQSPSSAGEAGAESVADAGEAQDPSAPADGADALFEESGGVAPGEGAGDELGAKEGVTPEVTDPSRSDDHGASGPPTGTIDPTLAEQGTPPAPRSARATRWWSESETPIVEGWLAIVESRR